LQALPNLVELSRTKLRKYHANESPGSNRGHATVLICSLGTCCVSHGGRQRDTQSVCSLAPHQVAANASSSDPRARRRLLRPSGRAAGPRLAIAKRPDKGQSGLLLRSRAKIAKTTSGKQWGASEQIKTCFALSRPEFRTPCCPSGPASGLRSHIEQVLSSAIDRGIQKTICVRVVVRAS
jgi:hypothetical protein